MNIPKPSRVSASISGVALGAAAPVLDWIQHASGLSGQMQEAMFIGVISILLFIPATLFVFGIESFAQARKDVTKIDKEIFIRMLCWLAAGGFAFAVILALQALV